MYALALGRWLTEAIPTGFWSLGSIPELSFTSTAYNIPTIGDIQGPSFLSSYNGRTLSNITGFVTAKGPAAFWLGSEKVRDKSMSIGIMIFSASPTDLRSVKVGDTVSLSAKVSEFRSASAPNDLHLTTLTSPTNINVLSHGKPISPVVLGRDRSPPTQHFSSLDRGGFLSVPENQTTQDTKVGRLEPDKYGLDFWESLEGQVVTIPRPVSLGFGNPSGEFWVRGNWSATGVNNRGGLTITFGPDGIPDGNPEAILVGAPLDETENFPTALGNVYNDTKGVVTYQSGFYYVLPFTAPKIISTRLLSAPPSTIQPSDKKHVITIGDYNVANMAPNSRHVPFVADHIANYLNTPDIMFVQEIQDNSGPTDDGVVSANLTLTTLVNAIQEKSGILYSFIDIAPVNNQDGGKSGGNIRQAYLYRKEKVELVPGKPGGPLNATVPYKDGENLSLTFNPGRIKPTDDAWTNSRKPLVAAWKTKAGDILYTINVHFTSKVKVTADFVNSILALDKHANVVIAGDFNEPIQARSVYAPLNGIVTEIDEIDEILKSKPAERYTYIFEQNCLKLDHMFLSRAVAERNLRVEHVHVNSWARHIRARASDHDPTVALVTLS